MIDKILENQKVKKLVSFFNSYYYPAFLFLIVLLTHCLALDIVGFIITVLCFFLSTVLCEDLRPAIPFILMFPYVVSTQNSPGYDYSEYYSNHTILCVLLLLGVLIILAFVIRAITRKEYKTFFDFKNKKLLIGFLLLIPCYALAGLFSGWLDFNSIIVSVIMIILQPIIYIVFTSGINSKKDNVLYLARVATLALVLMCLEIAFVYLLKYDIGMPLNSAWKRQIVVGSVVSNSASEFIVILLPFVFYLAYKEKRGYLFYIIAAISLIAIYFTLSRASLLFGIPTFIIGTIFLCFKGNNKKLFRVLSFFYLIILAGILIYVYASNNAARFFEFFRVAGLQSRGRFQIWSELFEKFTNFPIFGVGFSSYMQTHSNVGQIFEGLAHNTAIQILCSTGIIGSIFFIYHIFEVFKLFFTKTKINKTIIGVSVLLFLGISLVDQIYFFPNFTVIYTLLLIMAEKDTI